jgi:hypothetical protein
MAKPLPNLDVPVIDLKTGYMTQAWYEYPVIGETRATA